MNAATIVADALTETAVGPTQEQLDAIITIVRAAAAEARGNVDAFERIANERLSDADYPIQFSRDPNELPQGAPANVDLNGMWVRTPQHFDEIELRWLRRTLSHESVHVFQIDAATRRGDPEKMYTSAHRRMMPKGELDMRQYYTDKHEVMAYARSLIDYYRIQGYSRKQALCALRHSRAAGAEHAEQRNRFRKLAYAYAQELPETLEQDVAQAAKDTERQPTDDQKEAGNYAKGHVYIQGLDISIENAKGSVRKGTNKSGKEWSVRMPSHYGYIRGTEGKDKDHIDVYVGPEPDAETVYVVDQLTDERTFDEHKCLIGFKSIEDAKETYDAAFSDHKGPERRGHVTAMSMADFKNWLKSGNTKTPVHKLQEGLDPDDVNPQDYLDQVQATDDITLARAGFTQTEPHSWSLRLAFSREVRLHTEEPFAKNPYVVDLWFNSPNPALSFRMDRATYRRLPRAIAKAQEWQDLYGSLQESADPDAVDPLSYVDKIEVDSLSQWLKACGFQAFQERDEWPSLPAREGIGFVGHGLQLWRIKGPHWNVYYNYDNPVHGNSDIRCVRVAHLRPFLTRFLEYDRQNSTKMAILMARQELEDFRSRDKRIARKQQPTLEALDPADPDDIDPKEWLMAARTKPPELDKFTQAYMEAALWSTTDNSDDRGGEPLDANYGIDDISVELQWQMFNDCQEFQRQNAEALANAHYHSGEWSDAELAGHDFWLTRCGHGTGFWDRDELDPEVAEALSEAAKAWGDVYLEVVDYGEAGKKIE